MVGAGGGAAFTVKCFKLLHRLLAVYRLSIERLAILARVFVVLFCVVIWCAAEFHCHFTLPFIITFISCINDNECVHAINLIYLSVLNFVFINWHHFFFSIEVLVNKAESNASEQQNGINLSLNCVLRHRLSLSG